MNCPCGIDHWLHVAAGLQGIAGMMQALQSQQMRLSKDALDKLEEQMSRLQLVLLWAREEAKEHA